MGLIENWRAREVTVRRGIASPGRLERLSPRNTQRHAMLIVLGPLMRGGGLGIVCADSGSEADLVVLGQQVAQHSHRAAGVVHMPRLAGAIAPARRGM
ncbi:hypothetical protein WH91_21080 [Devosia psychrophila]|uniref:CheB-type methylesterase domain-containing protein n=1 Tax=Devosia psychrophila TaxID=728005 RepID=A0ABR5DT09_9HYPH|nr:hypothetical protein WH91_21080 [Devosia psychrophila]